MEYAYLTTAIVTTLVTGSIAFLLWCQSSAKQRDELARQVAATRDLEKRLHINDCEFLEERNRIELSNIESLRE